jgi:hypothetical protein
MQKFKVVLEVTVNTLQDIDAPAVAESLNELLVDWEGGTAEVKEVDEI